MEASAYFTAREILQEVTLPEDKQLQEAAFKELALSGGLPLVISSDLSFAGTYARIRPTTQNVPRT